MLHHTKCDGYPPKALCQQFAICYWLFVNILPYDKINKTQKLYQSNLKVIEDVIINETQKLKFEYNRVESIMGKEENAGYQHFLLFPQCFHNASLLGSLKDRVVKRWDRVVKS